MVSTLSGLNFSLYRERLRRKKYSFISIVLQSMNCLFLFYMNIAVHTFIRISSVLCHWLLTAVARSHTDIKFHNSSNTCTCTYPMTRVKGKVKAIHTTCSRPNLSAVAGKWLLASLCMVPHKKYLSTALPVLQRLEAIHKIAPTQQ